MRTLLSLFSRSPFGPTEALMERVMACVREVRPLFEAACADDAARMNEVVSRIDELETIADQAKNEIRNHLPKAVFLPIDRRDLLEIVHMEDSMADSLREAAELMTLKPLQVPPEMQQDVLAYVDDILATCEQAAAIMAHLGELVETVFSGPEAEKVLQMIDQLDAAETKSDVLERRILVRLFSLEDRLSPIDILLWYQILQKTGDIANYAERCGNRLRLLIAKA